MGKMNKKGFTLAELLIVIAIMAVLIAVAIPVFSAQLEKARHSVDDNTERAAKSLAEAHYLLEHASGDNATDIIECTFTKDDDGNLQILTCTGAAGATIGHSSDAGLPTSGDPVLAECNCSSGGNKGKTVKVTVTNGAVKGEWVDS